MGEGACPFEFNTDPATFKVGDTVSYRVPSSCDDWPFVGVLLEVHDDYVVVGAHPDNPTERYKASRESRPVVAAEDVV
ncbi:MAG: hypothetical protein ABW042_06690 [Phenylobacterium sp.]